MKNYGFLFGIIVGLLALALGVGPTLMSAIFDHHGSYTIAVIGADTSKRCGKPVHCLAGKI